MNTTAANSPYLDYTRAEAYTTLHRATLWRAVRFHVKDLDDFMASRNRK